MAEALGRVVRHGARSMHSLATSLTCGLLESEASFLLSGGRTALLSAGRAVASSAQVTCLYTCAQLF